MNIQHILIPVDFSEGSTQAIEYGVALANKFSSRVTLFHVTQPLATPPEGPMFPFDPYQQAMTDAAWKQLRELSTTLILDTEVEIDLISGIPWASIVDRAKSGGIDLIVMPTVRCWWCVSTWLQSSRDDPSKVLQTGRNPRTAPFVAALAALLQSLKPL